MAFDVIPNEDLPQFTVLTSYHVERLGQYPVCLATFAECVYLTAPPVSVTATEDLNGDGLKEILTVTAWSGSAESDVLNKYLKGPTGALIGQITSASLEQVTAAVLGPSGSVITPAVNQMKVTLTPAPATDIVGSNIAIITQNPVGALCYKQAGNGRRWTVSVDGSVPAQMQRMITMLGTIYFKAVKFALDALNVTKTDAEVQAAIQACALQGNNIDSIFGSEGDQLEIDRRAGTLVGFTSPGAPTIS